MQAIERPYRPPVWLIVVPDDDRKPLVSRDPKTCEEAEYHWNLLLDSLQHGSAGLWSKH